jgi:hypothetical protein
MDIREMTVKELKTLLKQFSGLVLVSETLC